MTTTDDNGDQLAELTEIIDQADKLRADAETLANELTPVETDPAALAAAVPRGLDDPAISGDLLDPAALAADVPRF